jgi:hypothetical protein
MDKGESAVGSYLLQRALLKVSAVESSLDCDNALKHKLSRPRGNCSRLLLYHSLLERFQGFYRFGEKGDEERDNEGSFQQWETMMM